MRNPDLFLFAEHAAFWLAFVGARLILRTPHRHGADVSNGVSALQDSAAPFSRVLVAFHMVAFGLMYFGMSTAIISNRVPAWFTWQRLVGAVVIASGAALAVWALAHFQSWRFRAQIEQGHQLATGGPFRFVRHPIYMGLNLLALGTAFWVPTVIEWSAFVVMVIGSDARARAEEALLDRAFGASYRAYRSRTRRFVPGVY